MEAFLKADGECPICEKSVEFVATDANLRDNFVCPICKSIPRERSLFLVLKTLYPNWKNLHIHESSPIRRGASERLRRECINYSFSQYDPSILPGSVHPDKGHRSEDLENLTFEGESFDIFVTQDVFEHLYHPDRAAKEIARVLRPGGAHILTTPLTQQNRASRRRCKLEDGARVDLLPPIFHGNPMSKDGSVVTVDWGYDILTYLSHHSGAVCSMYIYDDLNRGLRGQLMEVVVNSKVAAVRL